MVDLNQTCYGQPSWETLCEWCGVQPATDNHHMLIHRMKGIMELDFPHNIMKVCHECHMSDGRLNGWDARTLFWDKQCERYGEIEMHSWLAALPLKIKPVFGRKG